MLDSTYEWIKNIAFYLVIMTVVLEVLPGNGYKKYIRFFTGMIMILLVLTPVLRVTGAFGRFEEIYHSQEFELRKRELEQHAEYFDSVDVFDFLPEEYLVPEEQSESGKSAARKQSKETTAEEKIKVEEIRIGEDQGEDPVVDTVRE